MLKSTECLVVLKRICASKLEQYKLGMVRLGGYYAVNTRHPVVLKGYVLEQYKLCMTRFGGYYAGKYGHPVFLKGCVLEQYKLCMVHFEGYYAGKYQMSSIFKRICS